MLGPGSLVLTLVRCAFLCGVFSVGASADPVLSHEPDPLFHDGYEGVTAGPFNDADAARFLAQATFGATMADIAHLRALGYQAWLAEQFSAPASTEVPYLNWVENLVCPPDDTRCNDVTDDTRMQAWAINSVGTPDPSRSNNMPADQLRQRVAFALSEIFVVSNTNGTLAYEPWSLASFYDLLATDAFANYRDLLEDVTKHPAMGIFLSMIQNRKADTAHNIHPDQNYAREIMQLFSVGLNLLNVDGSLQSGKAVAAYTQATVEGFAAVFTGWDWNVTYCNSANDTCCSTANYDNCGPNGYDDVLWQRPMQPIEEYHDNTSDKQLLKYDGVALSGGVLTHGGDAQTELTAALDNIFQHPNVGPFIALRLIQRLVTSNPSPPYVQRVAGAFNDDGSPQHVRGNLRAVVQAILLDPEARYGQWQNPATFGKLREPLLKITHLWRAMAAASGNGRNGSLAPYPPLEDWFGEAPLRAPTVFNFFTPYFQQPGEVLAHGLASPEFQILTDTMVVATPNNLFHMVFCNYATSSNPDGDCYASDDADTMQTNDSRDAALAASNPAQLVDNYNLLFLSGQMSPFMKNVLVTRLNAISSGNRGASKGVLRVQHAQYLILNSPEYSVQK
jgi:uncharacterized protein (DUF1800 family)